MFDIGIGEIFVIGVIALLVFGPERLPKAAADAGRMLREIRAMAANARKDLADSAGVELGDAVDTVKSLREFHPKRIASSLLSDDPEPSGNPSQAPRPAGERAVGPAFDPDAT